MLSQHVAFFIFSDSSQIIHYLIDEFLAFQFIEFSAYKSDGRNSAMLFLTTIQRTLTCPYIFIDNPTHTRILILYPRMKCLY